MPENKECEHCKNYEAAFKNLEAKVDLLIRELIEGDKDLGRVGHVRRTDERLCLLERKMDGQLSPDHVKVVAKMIDLFGSYRFIFGMLATTVLALAGIGSIVIQLIKLLRGG